MPTVSQRNPRDSPFALPCACVEVLYGQRSINFVYGEGFRNKIAEPLTGCLVIRVIGILDCFENLCKSLRPTTVFGWTTSFTRHTNLLKRFLSKQNFFKKKFVLPAVPEIVPVQ